MPLPRLVARFLLLVVLTANLPAAETALPNPLVLQRADPWIHQHADGWYYFMGTVPEYDRLELRRARSLAELPTAGPKVIWRKHVTGIMGAHIWAPEIHFIDGKWYVYFAAGAAEKIWEIRIYVLENSSPKPLEGEWVEKGGSWTYTPGFWRPADMNNWRTDLPEPPKTVESGPSTPADNPEAVPPREILAWCKKTGARWHGAVADVAAVWKGADMFVLASRGGEGLPRALLEAASCARPLVVTDVPGNRHFVRDGIEGLIVPPADVAALSAALASLAGDAERRCQMGQAARHRLLEGFTEQHVRRTVRASYAAMLAGDGGACR